MTSTRDAVGTAPEPTSALPAEPVTRAVVNLAWPVVIERLSLSLLGAVDLALVGRYVGENGIAAVGIGTLMFWIPLSGALAVDIGASAVIARDFGSGDRSRVSAALQTAVLAAFLWGVLCTVVLFAGSTHLMRVMGAKEEVVPLGAEYLRAGSLAFPPMMVFFAVSGALRGMGNTWVSMSIIIVINALNALVTFLLISGVVADLGMTAAGIGYATAGMTGGALALIMGSSNVAPVRLRLSRLVSFNREAAARLFRIGLPVGLEEAQFMLAFLVYTRVVARLGTDQLAAHAVALRSLEVSLLPGFALGNSATALVSRYLGAGRPDLAEAVARQTRNIAVAGMVTLATLQFILAPYIVDLFVDNPDVARTGTRLLRVFAFALPAVGIHLSLSGALRGAGDVRFVLATFTFTAWGIRVSIASFMVIVLGLTVPFAWLGAVTENWVRALLVYLRFRRGAWKHLKV